MAEQADPAVVEVYRKSLATLAEVQRTLATDRAARLAPARHSGSSAARREGPTT